MMELRAYQADAIERLRAGFRTGIRRQLLVMPTGAGKTVLFCSMVQQASARGKRTWILAHRRELLDQISATLQSFNVEHGFIRPHSPMSECSVQVASVQSVRTRVGKLLPPDFLIVDEAHHCVARTTWGRILADYPKAHVLGVTATPQRLSGEGMGETFDALIEGPTTAELIAQGYLSPYRCFAPPSNLNLTGLRSSAGDYAKAGLEARVRQSSIVGDAIEHYKRLALGKRALAFCVSVDHARAVAEQFMHAGIASESIDGTSPWEIRRGALQRFRSGDIKVLVSCDILSEGLDVPGAEVAILLRPTTSLVLYRQQVGRVLRRAEGKDESLILDHAGNARRHGLPDDDYQWSLDGAECGRVKRGEQDYPVRVCPTCFAASPAARHVCIACGQPFPVEPPSVRVIAAQLEELKKVERKQERKAQGNARSLDELVALAKLRGYAHPAAWAWHVYNSRRRS